MDADDSTIGFEGHPGGAWGKVIRWSFERQGLFQPTGAPTPVTKPGAAPDIDVYIDDGRDGDYQPYLVDISATTDVWNRRHPDGQSDHQEPALGFTSHAYVRVKNRGTKVANNVTVKLSQSDLTGDFTWPTGWIPATTPATGRPRRRPPGRRSCCRPVRVDPLGRTRPTSVGERLGTRRPEQRGHRERPTPGGAARADGQQHRRAKGRALEPDGQSQGLWPRSGTQPQVDLRGDQRGAAGSGL